MKVKFLFATLLIFILTIFSSCTSKIQDNTNDVGIAISSPTIEASSSVDSVNEDASSNSNATPSVNSGVASSSPNAESPSNVDSDNAIKTSPASNKKMDSTKDGDNQSLTPADFKKYLNLPRSEYIKMLGSDYNPDDDYGTLSIPESHMNFPYLFLKDLGITLIFPTKEDTAKPTYIVVNKESNIKNINYKGAKPGMPLMDIANDLVNGTQSKSWVGTEDDVAYKLEYKDDGLNYCFVSYEESGDTFELYISNE